MQTFLPYSDFRKSLECLDTKRLGKQRVEALQLINTISAGMFGGWSKHPAAKMWQNHLDALKCYHDISISVWVERGYKNTMKLFYDDPRQSQFEMPSWLGDPSFHKSHQSNLLRKLPEHYSVHFRDVPHDLEYVWPQK